MKTHKIYECELCERSFLTEEEAKACEQGHTRAEVIEKQKYFPHNKEGVCPDELIVTMQRGGAV
jgi:hypothetical protein